MKNKRPLRVLEVMDIETGLRFPASHFLTGDEGEDFKLRRALSDHYDMRIKKLVCPLCLRNLKLRGGDGVDKKQLHFFHIHDDSVAPCPLDTGRHIDYETMRGIIYDGVKESQRHKDLKEFIGAILKKDKEFSNVIVDKLFARRNKNERRKPDVQGMFRDNTIIYEVQLSSDFLTVISARESYYKSKQAYLIWIFDKFSLDKSVQKFVEKDIFYSNNRNAFILDEEAIHESHRFGKLHLLAIFERPFIENGKIAFKMEKARITISDLTFNDDFTVHYNDFNSQLEKCQNKIKNQDDDAPNIIDMLKSKSSDAEISAYIHKKTGLLVPDNIDALGVLAAVVSAIEGRPCRSGHSNNKEVYNLFLNPNNRYPPKKFLIFHAVSLFHGNEATDPKILHKIDNAISDLQANGEGSRYSPRNDMNAIVKKLFPEEFTAYISYLEELGL